MGTMKRVVPRVPDELLNRVDPEELRGYVRKQAKEDRLFRAKLNKWLQDKFGLQERLRNKPVERVRNLFTNIEEKTTWSPGYNDDELGVNWGLVGEKMEELLKELREQMHRGEGDIRHIVEPVLEFFRQVQENRDEYLYDEERFELEGSYLRGEDMLMEWVRHPAVADADKRYVLGELRKFCDYSAYKVHGVYSMDDCYLDFLMVALPPAEAYEALIRFQAEEGTSIQVVEYLMETLRALGREDEAYALLLNHLDKYSLVHKELDRLCELGQLQKAAELADAYIRADESSTTSLEQRLRIAKLMHDTPVIIDIYYKLVTRPSNKMSHYRELKEIVPPADWPKMYEDIVGTLRRKRCSPYLVDIYDEEKDVKPLYELLLNDSFLGFPYIMKYLPRLPEEYHPKLLQKGISILRDLARRAGRREVYQGYAKMLKKFSKLPGAAPLVADLLAFIRIAYKRRSAMMEELKRL